MTTNATSPCDSFSVPIPANNSSTTSQRPSLPSASIGQSSTPVNVPRLHLQQLRTWSAQLRAIITVLELFAFVCACAARCDRNCSRWITVFCALCLICFWTALVLLLKRLFESPQLPQSKRWLQIVSTHLFLKNKKQRNREINLF